jgi:hypothetical protein
MSVIVGSIVDIGLTDVEGRDNNCGHVDRQGELGCVVGYAFAIVPRRWNHGDDERDA